MVIEFTEIVLDDNSRGLAGSYPKDGAYIVKNDSSDVGGQIMWVYGGLLNVYWGVYIDSNMVSLFNLSKPKEVVKEDVVKDVEESVSERIFLKTLSLLANKDSYKDL